LSVTIAELGGGDSDKPGREKNYALNCRKKLPLQYRLREADSRTSLFPSFLLQEQLGGFWTVSSLGSDFYNVALAWRIKGDVHVSLLGNAVSRNHAAPQALRTCFVVAGNECPAENYFDSVSALARFDSPDGGGEREKRREKKFWRKKAQSHFDLSSGTFV